MLAALLFLSILPLAAMPLLHGGQGDEADNAGDGGVDEDPGDGGDDIDPPEDDAENYAFDATPGRNVIEDFDPGKDSVEMDLTSLQGDVVFDLAQSANGSTFSVGLGDTAVTSVEFPGLSEVPVGDIFLKLTDADTGDIYHVSLSDAMHDDGDIRDPLDPDQPDQPGPKDGDEDIRDPRDPDQPDQPGPKDGDEDIRDPLDPDQPDQPGPLAGAGAPQPGDVAGQLMPDAAGEDAAADTPAIGQADHDGGADGPAPSDSDASQEPDPDQGDAAPGQDEHDDPGDDTETTAYWLYQHGASGEDVADVPDFRIGEDFLRVSLNPEDGEEGVPQVAVTSSDNGADGLVKVNGDLIAILRGAPGATVADVHAEIRPDMFS